MKIPVISYTDEKWKEVDFQIEYVNQIRVYVSNYGRLVSFNKLYPNGRLMNGTTLEGYRAVKLKLYGQRPPSFQARIDNMVKQKQKLAQQIRTSQKELAAGGLNVDYRKELTASLKECQHLYKEIGEQLTKSIKKNDLKRITNFTALVHRLVATNFLKQPTQEQQFVIHLDHNKTNNHCNNLKWATKQETHQHAQHSPAVIDQKAKRKKEGYAHTKVAKLSVPKVMIIKKKLNEGATLKKLARQFKVSDMQIHRIKTGENWADILPAT